MAAVGGTTSRAVVFGGFYGSGGSTGGGDLFVLGDLRPGNSPDSVLFDTNLYLGATTLTHIELGGTGQGQFDQMMIGADLSLDGDLLVELIDGFTLDVNQQFLITDVAGILSGTFSGLGEGSLVGTFGGTDLFITYQGTGANDVVLFTSSTSLAAAIPEPSTTVLVGVAMLGMIAHLRRRRKKDTPSMARRNATNTLGHLTILALALPLQTVVANTDARAEIIDGIDFPDGSASFADDWLRYEPLYQGGPAPSPDFTDPRRALGRPDAVAPAVEAGYLSLGIGGLVELLFIDNVLTNSGDATHDIHIFEVGPDVEATLVAVRPTAATALTLGPGFDANSDEFYEIGEVMGGTASLDIDSVFIGFGPGALAFDAVQLIDNEFELGTTMGTHGADINAVGAISSAAPPLVIPEPSTALSFGLASLGLIWHTRRRRVRHVRSTTEAFQ